MNNEDWLHLIIFRKFLKIGEDKYFCFVGETKVCANSPDLATPNARLSVVWGHREGLPVVCASPAKPLPPAVVGWPAEAGMLASHLCESHRASPLLGCVFMKSVPQNSLSSASLAF